MSDFQHIVPQFYLKGFVDPTSLGKGEITPYLWVVNIREKSVYKKAPKNIAGFTNYYDIQTGPFQNKPKTIDDSLSAIENRAAPIIHNIRDGSFQLAVKERYHLATFIGSQLGRVPIMRQQLDTTIDQFPRRMVEEFIKDDLKLKQKLGKDADKFKEYLLSGRIKPQINFKSDKHRNDFINSLSINVGIDFGKLVFGMRWVFLISKGESHFFASDNPTRLMSPEAKPMDIKLNELNEELEISFPVSPNCVLWGHSRDTLENPNIGQNEVREIDDEIVDAVNWSILPTIDTFAYCPTEHQASWVLREFRNSS